MLLAHLAVLLAHLAEVETRGAHRSRRCASLYTYCVYELRFSEDAAARRSAAARFAKEFPGLLDAVAAGELHLTGLLMIGPHLTPANRADVPARAKFRTKKELAKLVRELNPVPEVQDRVEPLGLDHEPMLSARNPSWEQFAAALSPQVRELPASEQPCNWANDGVERVDADETLPVGPVPSDTARNGSSTLSAAVLYGRRTRAAGRASQGAACSKTTARDTRGAASRSDEAARRSARETQVCRDGATTQPSRDLCARLRAIRRHISAYCIPRS